MINKSINKPFNNLRTVAYHCIKFKMAALTKEAISVTGRDRVKWTKIWDHKGYNSQIINIFKNSKFYKKKSKWPS